MTVPYRQSSFTGGEIADGLHARTDLRKYPACMRLLRNMIPRQEGPAMNRPGTFWKGVAKASTGAARLHPFIYGQGSLANNYELEFTAGHIRVWKAGVLMLSAPATPVDITTTYTDDDIPRLKFAQVGQVLRIFCKQKTTQELTWLSDTSWTLTDFAITRSIVPPANLAFVTNPLWATDTITSARYWEWVVTAVKSATKEESLPSNLKSGTTIINTNKPVQLSWDAVAGASEYNVYRGRNGKFGFVGTSTKTTFEDDGAYPVYAETPPSARDPFTWVGAPPAPPSTIYDNWPQVGAHHDQRLVVANAWNNPREIETSRMGEHRNFDRASPPKATDAATFNVESSQYEEVRSLVSWGRWLVVFTNAAEQMVSGSEGVLMQDDVVWDDQPTRWGSGWLDPITVGDTILFVQDSGASVRELVPEDKRTGNDLTLLGQHLFVGHRIVSWCYAHEPYRVLWAVREDGVLLSCTYVRQHETWAWARHDTGLNALGEYDKFESVIAVPEATETAVYALVKRYVNGSWQRYYEKLAPRTKRALEDYVFLDSAITQSTPGAPTTSVSWVGGHLNGRTVYALADGIVRGPFVVANSAITLPVAAAKVHVGLPIVAQGRTLDMFSAQQEIRPRKKSIKKVWAEVEESMPFKAGQRLTDVLERAAHPDGDPWTTPRTGLVQININGDWDDSGSVAWEHTDPTPLTIMSITREVDFGG